MTVRPATAADAPAIAAIRAPLIRDTEVTFASAVKSPGDVAAMIAERPLFLVAETGGGLAGFATYAPFRPGTGYAHTMEHTVILAEQARGRGLGRALMTALEDHARAQGAHVMVAAISSGNPSAIAFHARLGYAETGTMPEVGRKFGKWLTLHLMQKRL